MSPLNKTNSFNPKKLLLSKWTAAIPRDKQKHFVVTELVTELVEDGGEEKIVACVLEAVINKQAFQIDWRELKDTEQWIQGWR